MRLFYHPDKKDISLPGVLYALGDPIRLEIVKHLAIEGEQPCAAVCDTLGLAIAKSTMSHHFRVLREAGIIYSRKEGTQHLNSIRREELDACFPGLLKVILSCGIKMI
jgi:DNA-binding transcriptional ArsR family regulator